MEGKRKIVGNLAILLFNTSTNFADTKFYSILLNILSNTVNYNKMIQFIKKQFE